MLLPPRKQGIALEPDLGDLFIQYLKPASSILRFVSWGCYKVSFHPQAEKYPFLKSCSLGWMWEATYGSPVLGFLQLLSLAQLIFRSVNTAAQDPSILGLNLLFAPC